MRNMEDKYIDKYNELETEFFSTKVNWTYTWSVNSVPYCLDWNSSSNEYDYFIDGRHINSFKSIYDALDGIIINKKTLRQLILETDFDFDAIL